MRLQNICRVLIVLSATAPAATTDAQFIPIPWDAPWTTTIPVTYGPGSVDFAGGPNMAVAVAESTLTGFNANSAQHIILFERTFTLPAGGPYCVQFTTGLIGQLKISSNNHSASVEAFVRLKKVNEATYILNIFGANTTNYHTSVPDNGVLEKTSPADGWKGFQGSGFVLGPGQYKVEGGLNVHTVKTNFGGSSISEFKTGNNKLIVTIQLRTPPYVAQPNTHNSGIVCEADANAPARTRRNFTPTLTIPNPMAGMPPFVLPTGPPLGFVYDFEFAGAMNNAMANDLAVNLNFQFNECYSGGMIDELFDVDTYPNLNSQSISASAAAQHNEVSYSRGIGGAMPCPPDSGMDFGQHFDWAIWTWPNAPPLRMGYAFFHAEYHDKTGPISGGGSFLEHPQYQSNALSADQFRIGTRQVRRAIVFVGFQCSACPRQTTNNCPAPLMGCLSLPPLPAGFCLTPCPYLVPCSPGAGPACPGSPANFPHYIRRDYFHDVVRAKRSLDAAGYTTTILAGPGGAGPCDSPAAAGVATRQGLLNAIANLPAAGAQTKEYYVWIGDHGNRTATAMLVGNPAAGRASSPSPGSSKVDAGAGGNPTVTFEVDLDADFMASLVNIAVLDIERTAGAPNQPVRITIVDENGDLIGVVHDSAWNGVGLNWPDETLLSCPREYLNIGMNRIKLESLSPLMLGAIRMGTPGESTIVTGPNGDLNADGVVDALDLYEFLLAFGQSAIDPLGFVNNNFHSEADYDEDRQITLVDFQIWLDLYWDFVNGYPP